MNAHNRYLVVTNTNANGQFLPKVVILAMSLLNCTNTSDIIGKIILHEKRVKDNLQKSVKDVLQLVMNEYNLSFNWPGVENYDGIKWDPTD
jgi:hypothetical protein